MNLLLIKCLQLSVVIVNCQLLLADRSATIPDTPKIIFDEDDPLEITCGDFFPKNSNIANPDNRATSPANAVLNDIFRCADDTEGRVEADGRDQLDAIWIYVFVESYSANPSPFASSYRIKGIQADSDDTAVIPCRPTNSNDTSDKRDFIIKHVMLGNDGHFICQINFNKSSSDTIRFKMHFSVKPKTLNKPRIEQSSSLYVVGEELRLNCIASIQDDWDYNIEWTTRQNSDRINIGEMMSKSEEGTASQELTINNVTGDDEGEYICTVRVANKSNSTREYIRIHDPSDKFINLTATDNHTDYFRKLGSQVAWVVDYAGYPRPEIRWLDPQNRTIISVTNKYVIQKKQEKASLKILDLQIADMGVYTIEARSESDKGPQFKKLTFHLTVLSKPHLMMKFEKIVDYYETNEEVKFVCVIDGYPRPNVIWSFQEYSHDTSNHKEPEYLKDFIINDRYPQLHSTLTMRIKTSGTLLCEAHNEYGNDLFKHPIFVSDVPNGFGIIEPPEDITVGDTVELICAASIHNYTNSFEWDLDGEALKSLVENKKHIITETQTPFTYRSILQVNRIDKSDENKNYGCNISTNEGQTRRDEKRLVVNDPVEPYFIEVNMNGTENIYDTETARITIITLRCHVGGMPPPVISWWKDNQILNATDDLYMFANENRELEIKHPRTSDSGKYSCRAKNRLKTIEMYQRITIQGEKMSKVLIMSLVILLVICGILVVYFSMKIRRERIMRKQIMAAGLTHFEEGALECLNPGLTVDDQVELLPYDKKWEFPRERLKFGKQLGCGAFGVVLKAEAERICKNESSTTVAVKMVRRSTESTYIRALASELKIMVHLGKHLNVVNLLGACTRNIAKRELLVIVEYCRFGNLHNYLFRHRSDFLNQIDPVTEKIDLSIGRELLMKPVSVDSNRIKHSGLSFSRTISKNSNNGPELVSYTSESDSQGVSMSTDGTEVSNNSSQPGWRSNYRGDYKDQILKPICTQDLLSWAFQVARGMEYLSQRKVLHGDLAARNILLAENNIVKICDFGLAKTMYRDENYEKKGEALLPIKWMAIESIRDRLFSTQSDVWSFGIVLWEFFTLAETPYPGMGAEKQYQKLIEGYRMEKPKFSTDEIYNILLTCWEVTPSLRPTFTNLVQSIGNLLDESVKTYYLDLNTPYMDMNTMIFENGKNDYLTMMSAPDHEILSSRTEREYVNLSSIPVTPDSDSLYHSMTPANPKDGTRGLSLRNVLEETHPDFQLPQSKSSSDSHLKRIELSPMLKTEDDNYLKPINVQERRAEFVRQQKIAKNTINENKTMELDPDYCNAPQNLESLGIHDSEMNKKNKSTKKIINEEYRKNINNYIPDIITTQNNYVNMTSHKKDSRKDVPDSFSNPSYVFMANIENDATRL